MCALIYILDKADMKKVFTWSLIAAFGGFLFGLDTAVISGAEQTVQKLWGLSVFEHGLTVSIALIGTVVGAMLGRISFGCAGATEDFVLDRCDLFGGLIGLGAGGRLVYVSGVPVPGWSWRRMLVGYGADVYKRDLAGVASRKAGGYVSV